MDLRAVAKAVGRLRDHELAERGHQDEDEDGHQLNKQSQASLLGKETQPNHWNAGNAAAEKIPTNSCNDKLVLLFFR